MNTLSRQKKRYISNIIAQSASYINKNKRARHSYDITNNNDKDKVRIEEDLEHLLEDINGAVSSKDKNVYSKDNHIYFQANVTKDSVTKLIDLLDEVNEEYSDFDTCKYIKSFEPNPIYLHISSYGGDMFYGFTAIDAIRKSKIPVHTIIEGYAASCGSLMAIAGQKRYMTPNSSHLMHQLSSGVIGKFGDIEDEFNNCQEFMDKIISLYQKCSSMTRKEIIDQLKHDNWWDAKKCLKVNIIDEIWK